MMLIRKEIISIEIHDLKYKENPNLTSSINYIGTEIYYF